MKFFTITEHFNPPPSSPYLLTTTLARGLDQRQDMDCLLDYSKAFDTVAHHRHLYKADCYRLRERHQWLMG